MIQQNTIGSLTELYVGGGNYITENYPTLYPTFSTRKILTAGDSIGNYKEVTPEEKATIESNVANLIKQGNGYRTERTPLFEAAGAVFNDRTGYYELNTLTDITERQMEEIHAEGVPTVGSHQATCITHARTFLGISNHTGQIPLSALCDCFCMGNRYLEVVANFNHYLIFSSSLRRCFSNSINLKRIGVGNEYINAPGYLYYKPSDPSETFSGLPMLEHVYINKLRSDIQFRDSPLLDYDSVRYMIANAANTTAITIYVHADVMAKLNTSDFVIPDGKRLIASAVAVERDRTKAQWQALASRDEDYWTGAPVETLGIKAGDIVLVGGKCTDSTSEFATIYFQVTEVDGTTITGKNLSLFFNSWEVIRRMASAKNITFATLT